MIFPLSEIRIIHICEAILLYQGASMEPLLSNFCLVPDVSISGSSLSLFSTWACICKSCLRVLSCGKS